MKYSSQGLIEAILAVAIAGIACLVFLDIASTSITVVQDISKSDQLVKVSAETAEKVRKIAERNNNSFNLSTPLFPDPETAIGYCYEIIGDFQQPSFVTNFVPACTSDASGIESCRNNASLSAADNVFSVYCVTSVSNSLVLGKVYTGLKVCQTTNSGNCRVSDSEYVVAVYVENNVRSTSCNFDGVCNSPEETADSCLSDCYPGTCFGGCGAGCPVGTTCDTLQNKCVNPACPTETDCICPVPGVCQRDCGTGCPSGTTCQVGSNICKNPTCPNDGNCICPTTVTACNGYCDKDFLCDTSLGFKCVDPATGQDAVGGVCRNTACLTDGNCVCPTTVAACNAACDGVDILCGSGKTCIGGVCKNTSCTGDANCICPTTVTACNAACDGVDILCGSGKSCVGGVCKNTSCTGDADCICPVTVNSCNGACDVNNVCGSGKTCVGGVCKNTSCTGDADCICPVTVNACNGACDVNNVCGTGKTCVGGVCKNSACTGDANCICPTTVNTCGGTCNVDFICGAGKTCYGGVCRNVSCPTQASCVCSVCGNGACEAGENATSCYSDCHCGDAYCSRYMGESSSNCPVDCFCGNGSCESNEIQNNPYCKKPTGDCMSSCGAGGCQADKGENTTTCQYDCGSSK
jgi:hypothetical protein